MKRAVIMAMIASTLLAGLASGKAAASGPSAAKGQARSDESGGATSRSMDAPYLAAPVMRDGQLVNYLFVSARFEVSANVDLWRTREKAHYLRDALVRASHANDLADPNDPDTLNEARTLEVYAAAAARALGEGAISRVAIVASYSSRGSGV